MNKIYTAFDTSNYTTSVARASGMKVISNIRIPLSVNAGERGLRQSDAVFLHVSNLPEAARTAGSAAPAAVGYSAFPRRVEGSYMPCFTVGAAAAAVLAGSYGVPLYKFSHQEGHVAAALYSAGRLELWGGEFLAFHISGGTTELLYVNKKSITKIGGTLDISAGKLIDRTGVKLGMNFPCGPAMEKAALTAERKTYNDKICVKGSDCNLSGVENKVDKMIKDGVPAGEISYYVLNFILRTISEMTEEGLNNHPGLPVLYAGGVMSCRYISETVKEVFNGIVAEREFSCDNAAGIALLTEMEAEGY